MSLATAGVPAAKASVRTMPKLSPPSDGAHEHVGGGDDRGLLGVAHAPEHRDAARVEDERLDLLGRRADHHELRGDTSRSASKARRRIGRPLRSTAWPTKAIRSGAPRRRPAPAPAASAGRSTPLGTTR